MKDTGRPLRAYHLPEATGLLTRTPATLDAWLRGLPDAWIHAHEGGDTWSPFDVIGHLVHAERTNWIPRARMILEHGETRAFEDFDRLAQFADADTATLAGRLDAFAAARAESLRALADMHLTEADLDRRGLHPAFGAVTLRQLLATWVVHDLDHLTQIARVLATQYTDAIGPWREYLRIVR